MVAGEPGGCMSLEEAGNLSLIFTFLSSIICHCILICHPYEKRGEVLTNVKSKYTRLYCVIASKNNIRPLCHGTLNVTTIYIYNYFIEGS
jgi:hypothetical protein